jgi:hypothetical protein
MLRVRIAFDDIIHTLDEQGITQRTCVELIFHAANRYACTAPERRFYLNPKG